jgi:hypothetical protein
MILFQSGAYPCICPGIAGAPRNLVIAHTQTPRLAPKPAKNRRHLRLDNLAQVWQHEKQILEIDHDSGAIVVPYIDAEDGTPVIDIKPYHPATDRVRDVSVPDWCSHWPKWHEDSAGFNWAAEFENVR